ncbi:MAG TPA: amidase family protein, partial [Alphaproteobacteria bacterium]|nr:amidase family protein [Alphaproteobacteria bacterium]
MTVDLDLCYTPAAVIARRIRDGELSPVRVVENALRRIAEVDPHLNAFCFVYPDEAMDRAREAERQVAAGRPLGPLHGVPVAIKDMTPTRGKRTTLGSRVYEHWVPDRDALVVERLAA